MSIKYQPQDRIVVTNFRYNPSSTISIFDTNYIKDNVNTVVDGGALVWDAAQNAFVTKVITASGGTYDDTGKQGLADLTIRFSDTATEPLALTQGELAYSFLPNSLDANTNKMSGGETLYIGDANGNPVAIASQRTYDYLNHKDGINVANSALIVGAKGEVNQLTIGGITYSGSTLSVVNPNQNLNLSPGGNANISATDHRIINLADPIAAQDAVTKNYVDTAIANFSLAPVTISDLPPAAPDHGDLWYDSDETYRLYVWDNGSRNWVDASPSVGAKATGLVVIANNAPTTPELGQAWYDQTLTGRTYVWDGDQWVDMNPQAGAIDSGPHVTVSEIPPSAPDQGDLWYDSKDTYRLYVWDNGGAAWIDASPDQGDSGPHVVIAEVAPATPEQGDMWYDSNTTFRTYVWDNTAAAWIDASPDQGSSTAIGLITISNDPPAAPEIGQAWYDQDLTGRTYAWDGMQWVDIAPQGDTAVGSFPPFEVLATAPATPSVGDAWYNTADEQGYVWDGAGWVLINTNNEPHVTVDVLPPSFPEKGDMWYNQDSMLPGYLQTFVWDGLAWVEASPHPVITEKAPIIIANSAPATPLVGAAWYDQNGTGRTYVWDGAQWVDMNPTAPSDIGANITIADMPPLSPNRADLWYDSDNTYRLYIWDDITLSWVDASPNSSSTKHTTIANTAPSTPLDGDMWYDSNTSLRTYVWSDVANTWLDVAPSQASTSSLVLVASSAPIVPAIGQAWYDQDGTGRTYVWDGMQWVDMNPIPDFQDLIPDYVLLDNSNLSFAPNGITVNLVGTYLKYVVEIVDCSLINNTLGVGLTVLTSTKTVSAATIQEATPFTYSLEFNNFVDGLGLKPSTYLLNKYSEQALSLEIKPKDPLDTFTSGLVKVWGIKK